jgi:formylglycine-generating enzyme required for sulfatase activity
LYRSAFLDSPRKQFLTWSEHGNNNILRNSYLLCLIVTMLALIMQFNCDATENNGSGDSNTDPASMTDSEIVAADAAATEITFGGTDSEDGITTDITLPTTGENGSTITWSSDNPDVIASDGTVTQPPYGSGDTTITLTATITSGGETTTVTYVVVVLEAPPTDSYIVATDTGNLAIGCASGDSASSVTQNVGLSTAGSYGTNINWAATYTSGGADASSVVASNGTVTRPACGDGNASVTLTATIAKNAASDTKVFDLTVIEAPPAGSQVTLSTGGVAFNMRYVPGKTTFTGTTDATQATVTSGYLIAETEVTYELWNTVKTWATSNGYTFANVGTMGDGSGDNNRNPVTTINWRDAIVWTNALTEYYNAQNGTSYAVVYTSDAGYTTPIRSSADGAYGSSVNSTAGSFDNPYVNPDAKGFRLPTSDEWELAARYIDDANGDGDIMDAGEYYPGNYASGAIADYNNATITGHVSWYSVNSGSSTHTVGLRLANALGLFDLSGNVLEWAYDWHPSFIGSNRVGRGGGWYDTATGMQVGGVSNGNPYGGATT